MSLRIVPIGVNFLSSNLKIGLLAGTVGIAASTGTIATVTNSESLGTAFETAFKPVKSFLSTYISPHLGSVYEGSKKIGEQLGTWSKDAYSKKSDLLNWVTKNLNSSLLKSGFNKIFTKTKDWGTTAKTTLSSGYQTGKNTVIPFLSQSDQVRNLLYHGSEVSNVLKALGVLLTASAFTSAAGVAGGGGGGSSEEEDEDDEADPESVTTPPLSKFWELVKSGNLGEVIPAVWDLVTNNLNIVKQLEKPDVNRIVDFVLNNSDQVKKRVEDMKNPKESKDAKKGEDSGQWGNYKTTTAFMDALIPPPDLVQALLKILQETLGENFSNYLSNPDQTISSENITSILGCTNESSDQKAAGSGNTCPENLNIKTLLEKLLGGDSSASAAVVSVDK